MTLIEQTDERRHLTIMFGDMIGSTRITADIGSDSMHELMKPFRHVCIAAILENDGIPARWMGDGFMALFGYPARYEDAAVRGVRAGLAVVDAVVGLGDELQARFGVAPQIRVGLHTGTVIVSPVDGFEDDIHAVDFVGQTTNLAARLESSAMPNSVVVSEATHRVTRGFFRVEPLETVELKGIDEPMTRFRVIDATGATNRFEAQEWPLTPLVGREDCLAAMLDCIGGPDHKVAAFSGEAGIGKTRLLHEVESKLPAHQETLTASCRPRSTSQPLFLFAELVKAALGHSEEETAPYDALETALAPDLPDASAIARIANLLGIDRPESVTLPDVTVEQALRETADALRRWVVARAQRTDLILVLDDVHWIDPTSRDLIEELARPEHLATLLFAHRPEDTAAWVKPLCDLAIELTPLTTEQSAELIRCIADTGAQEVSMAAGRSDGVPLFAEELGRVLDVGEIGGQLAIPSTLKDLIASRLDRLPEAKTIAQLGATLGRQFDPELLAEVAGLGLAELQERTTLLLGAGILQETTVGGGTQLGFRHALIQEAAYESQVREQQQQVHAQIADVVRRRAAPGGAEDLAVVAHHLQHAGPVHRTGAIEAWLGAGLATAAQGAHLEAVSHYENGRDLLDESLDPVAAAPLELGLQLGFGASLSATAGYGHSDVIEAFSQARKLCAAMGSPPELFPAVWGSWAFHLVRGDYDAALDLARAAAIIASGASDRALDIEAAAMLGLTLYYRGELDGAREQLKTAVGLYGDAPTVSPFQTFQHPAVAAMSHLALVRLHDGDPQGARATALAAVELAGNCEEHLRWYAREYAHTFAAALGSFLDDPAFCLKHAQIAIDVCHQYGSRMFLAGAEIYNGWAQTRLGEHVAGLERLEAACEAYLLTGATLFRPYQLTLLAQSRSEAGNVEGARQALNEAHDLATTNGELIHLDHVASAQRLLVDGSDGKRQSAG